MCESAPVGQHRRRREAGEPGVAGVRVSNAVDVAITDTHGAYELPLPDEGHVFVVKPRGYMTPTDELNIPRYYYTHMPVGSRDDGFDYTGAAPTGPPPRSIDFPLTRTQDREHSFKAILIADPQPYTIEEVRYYRDDVLDGLVGTDAAFAITSATTSICSPRSTRRRRRSASPGTPSTATTI